MKYYILISLGLLTSGVFCQCPLASVIIDDQGDVDSFTSTYPNCNAILGSVQILNENLSHIDSLYQIDTIYGSLIINNTSFKDLKGLENINYIGGDISLLNNDSLIDLSDLSSLRFVGGDILISANEVLTSINAFNNIQSTNGNIFITNNPNLQQIGGFEALTNVNEFITITNNVMLADLSSLTTLERIGKSLTIFNTSIRSLNGLENLSLIGRDVLIAMNDSLASFSGLGSSSPQGLEAIGNFGIINNSQLESLAGLDHLTRLSGNFVVSENAKIKNLAGVENLDSIGATLRIVSNPELKIISGFNNLRYIGVGLSVNFNENLTALDMLSGPIQIGDSINFNDRIEIISNDSLSDITTLDLVIDRPYETYNTVTIENNPNLSVCELDLVCNLIINETTRITVNGNNIGCQSEREVEEKCNATTIESHEATGLIFYPNPTQSLIYFENLPLNCTVMVFNAQGERLMKKVCDPCSSIDVSSLQSGVYFMILSSNLSHVSKFIKI